MILESPLHTCSCLKLATKTLERCVIEKVRNMFKLNNKRH